MNLYIKVTKIFHNSFLLLGPFRFCETHFPTYQRFVADPFAIFAFLCGWAKSNISYCWVGSDYLPQKNQKIHSQKVSKRLNNILKTVQYQHSRATAGQDFEWWDFKLGLIPMTWTHRLEKSNQMLFGNQKKNMIDDPGSSFFGQKICWLNSILYTFCKFMTFCTR